MADKENQTQHGEKEARCRVGRKANDKWMASRSWQVHWKDTFDRMYGNTDGEGSVEDKPPDARQKSSKRSHPNCEDDNSAELNRVALQKKSRKQVKFSVQIPIALKRSSFDLAMLKVEADDVPMIELPPHVVAIDFCHDDLNTISSVYNAAIVKYAKTQEKNLQFTSTFVDHCPNKGIYRAILVGWLLKVKAYLRLKQETLHLAIQMLDRFLARNTTEIEEFQLLGITCLFLATKYNDRRVPRIDQLIKLTKDSYTFDDITRMERKILTSLGFQLHIPTPITFLDRGLEVIGKRSKLADLSRYILDLALACVDVVHLPPSVKAAAAIYLAQYVLNDVAEVSSETCIHSLAYHLHCDQDDVTRCVSAFAKLLQNLDHEHIEVALATYRAERRPSIGSPPSSSSEDTTSSAEAETRS